MHPFCAYGVDRLIHRPMPEKRVPPDPLNLSMAAIAHYIEGDKPLPVDQWHPAHCGDSEMRIARDGTWFHQGTPITRPAMVRLFSRVLRREPDGSFVLVTPAEKLSIIVEDAPFVAVEMTNEGAGRDRQIGFRLNSGEFVIAGPDHRLRLDERPYVEVRAGLDALIARSVYYELVDQALAEGETPPAIWSNGARFEIGAS